MNQYSNASRGNEENKLGAKQLNGVTPSREETCSEAQKCFWPRACLASGFCASSKVLPMRYSRRRSS